MAFLATFFGGGGTADGKASLSSQSYLDREVIASFAFDFLLLFCYELTKSSFHHGAIEEEEETVP